MCTHVLKYTVSKVLCYGCIKLLLSNQSTKDAKEQEMQEPEMQRNQHTVSYCCKDTQYQKDLNRNYFEVKTDKTHSRKKIVSPEN